MLGRWMSVAVMTAGLALSAGVGCPAAAGDEDPFPDKPRHNKPDDKRDWKKDDDHSLSKEQLDEAMAVLRRVDPEKAKEVEAQYQRDPEGLGRELRKRFPRIEHFLGLKRWDPEMFDLRVEDMRLTNESQKAAAALRDAKIKDDSAAERKHEDDLERIVTEHFDIRQRIREREIQMLEKRIEQLREQLEKRDDEKDDFIERRISQLTLGDKHDQW